MARSLCICMITPYDNLNLFQACAPWVPFPIWKWKRNMQCGCVIMPSIRETTGTVLLEAMSKGIPVITINKFGGATLFDENTGWLYEGNSKEEYIERI